tara:strand:+ start:28 stop:147 length:120 start_codon:yes stop_codon:yes gene_type:complete
MSKNDVNAIEPQRLRLKAKLAKKIESNAEVQRNLGRMDK